MIIRRVSSLARAIMAAEGSVMSILGLLLAILATPLLLGYYNGGRKNISWRNLGIVMLIFGIIIMVIPAPQ